MSDSGYGVACCNNPNIITESSTCDQCTTCGWSYDYTNHEETQG